MGHAAAKATRRNIRRALGPAVLDTIDNQGTTLNSAVLPRLMTLGQTQESVDHRLGALEERAAELAAAHQTFAAMTGVQRLRWVLGL